MEDTKLAQARRRSTRRLRLAAGLRDLTIHHRAKLLLLIGYLLAIVLVWCNKSAITSLFPQDGISSAIIQWCFGFTILFVGAVLLVELIMALGAPKEATRIQNALTEAGFTNAVGLPPLLLSVYKMTNGRGWIFEFDPDNISISRWDKEKDKIGVAIRHTVISVKLSKDNRRVLLHTVPLRSALPEKIYWKPEYLSSEDFVLVLGMGLTGVSETFNLANTPHLLLGGGTGSGKSVLLKGLLMQSLLKGASVKIADMKGGVDFSSVWHKKCRMIFDQQELLDVLDEMTQELERRRTLFRAAETPDIDVYNRATGANLRRIIFACDEVAEVLDKTGLSKEEKEIFSNIERHLSLIARQGRAFGLHLFLSTQRPSADLIPGQIRSNLTLRICVRADDILSRIILDSPAAADQIALDAQGRFVTNMGQIFQGFLFDERILEDVEDHILKE